MSLELITVSWGAPHIDMWQKACLKSLSFKDNRRALYEHKAVWNFFTEDKYFEPVEKMIYAYLPELKVIFKSKSDLRRYIDPIQAASIMMMENCIESGNKLLMVPPDTIWGNGSVGGVLSQGVDKGSCVVVPHVRVHPSILDEDLMPFTSNPELVKLCWSKNEDGSFKHLHRAWTDAELGHRLQNSYVGGVVWKKANDKTLEVIHRLPTVYLADFTLEDLNYFKNATSFGGWDHTWPGDILVGRGRQRFVMSSDIAFMAEITESHKNVPPLWPGDPADFWRKHAHNEVNKKITSIFRME